MNKTFSRMTILTFITGHFLLSCKRDDDKPQKPQLPSNDMEVITTMTLTFTDISGMQPLTTATFRDPDGDGGNPPTEFDTIFLQHNTTYNTSIVLLDETKIPADTISNEVFDESADHLFCFTTSGTDIEIVRTDTDGIYEVGLQSEWAVGLAGNGTVQVTLRHQPGIKDGTCAPGETDVEVSFKTVIQ